MSAFAGKRGAPCHVWSELLSRACRAGCEYFYQLNDDIQLVSHGWAEELTETLRANPYLPNFGITGPLDTNNARIMTQSFVHCTHLQIFDYYFPQAFRNWYSDDWATQVYGKRNTFWRRDIEVNHALAHLGPRYAVSYEDKAELEAEVDLGRQRIQRFLDGNHPQLPNFTTTQLSWRDRAVVPEG